jgi:hypothetical protein
MLKEKASAVKRWMVVGKLSTLLLISPALASTLENPRFYDYQGGSELARSLNHAFGWFRTLSNEQKLHYSQSITHALEYAENGQAVSWYHSDASGRTVPVITWPSGDGYCRRLHIEIIAYNQNRLISATACYSNSSSSWRWLPDKY